MIEAIPRYLQFPEGSSARKYLEQKNAEYGNMAAGRNEVWGYLPPSFAYQFSGYRDICHQFEILSAVLRITPGAFVDTWRLAVVVAKKYGNEFDLYRFFIACALVGRYIEQAITLENLVALVKNDEVLRLERLS